MDTQHETSDTMNTTEATRVAKTSRADTDLTEATNASIAALVTERYRARLAYVRSTDKAQAIDRAAGWVQYQHGVWTREGAETAALVAVEETIRALLKDVTARERDSTRLRERTRDLLNALNRMPAIKQVATYKLDRSLRDFNPDPFLLNVQGGTLDLRALDPEQAADHPMLLRPPRAQDLCSMQVQAAYVPDAMAPRWLTFLSEVFSGDQETIAYLQRALGYTLLGANPEHAMFLCFGGGGNGKSTLLDTVTDVLGSYAGILSPDVLVSDYVRTGSSLQPEMTAHRDTRLIVSSEPKKGVLNGHRLKSWTGDTHIQVRMLYGEPETMAVTFTLWLMTNVLPDLNEHTLAVERRMHVIPFTANFIGKENLDLKAELAAERDGILAWMVEGLRQWYQLHGLHRPESIKQAAVDWYEGESLYARLFSEILTRGQGSDRILLSQLAKALEDYVYGHAEDFPRVVVNTKLVENFIKSHGLVKRTVGGQVWVFGVRLATEGNEEPEESGAESPFTMKEQAYLAVVQSIIGIRAVDVAEQTGLPPKSLYVVLQRLVDIGALEVRERAVYRVNQRDPITRDESGRARLQFLAGLAEKVLRADAVGEQEFKHWVDPGRLGRRIGVYTPRDAQCILSVVAARCSELEESPPGASWEQSWTNSQVHFTWHTAPNSAAA